MSAENLFAQTPFSPASLLEVLCRCGVSSHYLILRDGRCLRLVPHAEKAWHSGGSIMPPPDNRRGVNDFSLGIELAAHPDGFCTRLQYRTLVSLLRSLRHNSNMQLRTITSHACISGARAVALGLRQTPKTDPGPVFDWACISSALSEQFAIIPA
jgi:AmpD protein